MTDSSSLRSQLDQLPRPVEYVAWEVKLRVKNRMIVQLWSKRGTPDAQCINAKNAVERQFLRDYYNALPEQEKA